MTVLILCAPESPIPRACRVQSMHRDTGGDPGRAGADAAAPEPSLWASSHTLSLGVFSHLHFVHLFLQSCFYSFVPPFHHLFDVCF